MGTTQSTFNGIGYVVFTRNVTEPVLVTEVKLRLKGSNLLFKTSLSHQTTHLRSGVVVPESLYVIMCTTLSLGTRTLGDLGNAEDVLNSSPNLLYACK